MYHVPCKWNCPRWSFACRSGVQLVDVQVSPWLLTFSISTFLSTFNPLFILITFDPCFGVQSLVAALCSEQITYDDRRTVGCAVSACLGFDRSSVIEFYDLCGSHRFEHGRPLFYRATSYDALMFAHDLTDPGTRAAISRIWVPETMAVLGNIKGVDAGGRLESAGPHARSRGVVNELRLLWLHLRSKHAGVRSSDALREASRLVGRYVRLVLNEYNIWTDEGIDRQAEKDLLSSASVPVAIVGLKRDLDPSSYRSHHANEMGKTASAFSLCSFESSQDPAMNAFLQLAADHARRKSPVSLATNSMPNAQVELPF
jgi:hypothetical protein